MQCVLCSKEFIKTKHNKLYCSLDCQRLYNQRRWIKNNKEKLKIYRERTKEKRNLRRREKYRTDKKYRDECKQKVELYRKENPYKKRENDLKKYGLDYTSFLNLLKLQNGKCAICGYDNLDNKNFFPVVDHCHKKNNVRGLLCMSCNIALGQFKDNIIILKNAIKYLRKNNE